MTRKASSVNSVSMATASPAPQPGTHRLEAPTPPPATPAALPQEDRSCSQCIHAVPGRFTREDGKPTAMVPDSLLFNCEKGEWPNVVLLISFISHPKIYRQKAAACPHFSAS